MKRNPIEISNYVKHEYTEYIASTYTVDDFDYQKQIDDELKKTKLFNGPYLYSTLPFSLSLSLRELINNNIISKEFLNLSGINLDRKLYSHQVESINKIKQGKNLVITTGTGSGKTESFLYPIINYIMSLIENNKKEKGIKAIFLYPMNALVNDQKDRIREILREYPDITFGSFTGDTPESGRNSFKKTLMASEGVDIPDNELLTRTEMRKEPPDLLFTNYSMLEYILIRPQDSSIISSRDMNQWQFFVLDEAHTYKGTLGIEVSILIRRLLARVNKSPQFILTSATLGDKDDIENITQFAKNLTSRNFGSDDVIFAKRIPLSKSNIKYTISSQDYCHLLKNIKNIKNIKSIANKYGDFNNEDNVETLLYKLLIQDNNVYLLYDSIQKNWVYENVRNEMGLFTELDEIEFISLVQLISIANNSGTCLYDAKFHMFITSPNRAFITLGNKKYIKFGNQKSIDNLKAFEIGVCKNCNHMYIIGNIEGDYLMADDTVDVYENYEDSMNLNLDFFILEDDDEHDNLQKYTVCSKCGFIFESDNLNHDNCSCGNEFKVNIYKVDKSKSQTKNNITKCVHCGQNNNVGIIRSFHLNKDNATAVLAQIYYAAIEGNEKEEVVDSFNDDMFSMSPVEDNKTNKTKQLLAFSDSRQQASYFSVSFNYNHEKYLKRRIIWELVKEEESMKIVSLVSKLKNLIRDRYLFDLEKSKEQSQAWTAVLSDILYVDGQYGPEGLGLYTYEYDMSEIEDKIYKNSERIYEIFGLSVVDFITLIRVTINRFRKQRAINYDIAELSDQEKKDAFQYVDKERIMVLKKEQANKGEAMQSIVSFLPVKDRNNNLTTTYLQKICKVNNDKALEMAERLFSFMIKVGILVEKDDYYTKTKGYQVRVDNFVLKPYDKVKWYMCTKCKKISLYNINDMCIEKGCEGELVQCSPNELFKDNFFRKQYMSKDIESVIVKEHTAQLSKEQGRKYQKDFKEQKINILSCSTTFEMGVDIGSLENVFLRNVPPTPANYVQRAGRAGRSKDSAALILTYCDNNSHDYSYFSNPIEMIKGIVNPPLFNISNQKIILRHILASAFGFFFRRHKDLYENTKLLIFENQGKDFLDYINSKPKDLLNYLDNKVLNGLAVEKYLNYGWLNEINDDESKLNIFISDMVDQLSEYVKGKDKSISEEDYDLAKYFQARIKKLQSESIITLLSDNAVIPKYGFPINVVDLDIVTNSGKNDKYNLQRDLSIAISEYAPESEIIVDGDKYISRYIKVPRTAPLQRYYYHECSVCKNTIISLVPFEKNAICPKCGEKIEIKDNYFIIPSLGFSTDRTKKASRNIRPKKTYAGMIKYLGGGNVTEEVYEYKEKLDIRTMTNDSLLVMNVHNFYYCPDCGYTLLKKGVTSNIFKTRSNHTNMFGFPCENKNLEKIALGHIFQTDVISINLNQFFSNDEMLSAMYAILEGISYELQIERNDINGLLVRGESKDYSMILFDNVPGGAGHVKRIVNDEMIRKVLNKGLEIVSKDCCDEETSCNKCLRNYYNQSYHKQLKRKHAIKVLMWILDINI